MKKHFLLGTLFGIGTGVFTSITIAKHKQKKIENHECFGCGNCKSHKEDESIILYEDDDGKILKSPISILENYVGKPMPKPEKLTLYFAATSKDCAMQMCKDKCTFKLSACNGRLVCDTDSKPSCYVGIILPVKELFLWALSNEKVIYVKPMGEMYLDPKRDDRWYVDVEIIENK